MPLILLKYEAYQGKVDKSTRKPELDYLRLELDSREGKRVVLNRLVVPNTNAMFAVPVAKTESAWTNTKKLKIELSEQGFLIGVNGQFEDVKLKVASSILNVGIGIAKFSAGVVLKANEEIIWVPKIEREDTWMARVSSSEIKARLQKSGSWAIADVSLQSEWQQYKLSMEEFVRGDGELRAILARQQDVLGGRDEDLVNIRLSIRLAGEVSVSTDVMTQLEAHKTKDSYFDGLVTQHPRVGQVTLFADRRRSGTVKIGQAETTFPDLGGLTVLTVKGRSWATNSVDIGFYPDSGAIKSYERASTSQAEAVSSFLDSSTASVLKAQQEIEAAKLAERKAEASRAIAVQGIELDILKKEQELEALNASEDLDATGAKRAIVEKELSNLRVKKALTSQGLISG